MTEAAITAVGLRKRYGDMVALDGLNFEARAGAVTGPPGPNGAGKTTTVAILSTALRADGGQARVCGTDVAGDPARVRGLIGFAGQFAAVDPRLTGRENLELIGRLSGCPGRWPDSGPASCWHGSGWPRQQAGWCAPTSVGCGGAWTWRPPSPTGPRCCSWMSRPPAWTWRAARLLVVFAVLGGYAYRHLSYRS